MFLTARCDSHQKEFMGSHKWYRAQPNEAVVMYTPQTLLYLHFSSDVSEILMKQFLIKTTLWNFDFPSLRLFLQVL